jgi:predicted metal-binding transcription factor (methanogenesis marker protein 9)
MSEEETISEEEKDVKLLEIIQALSELGENAIANQLFKKIEKKLEFVSLPDWEKHQICETFPECDLRTLVYCCAPTNPCPYRAAVLRKLGLSLADYIKMKRRFATMIEPFIFGLDKKGDFEEKTDGKDKGK